MASVRAAVRAERPMMSVAAVTTPVPRWLHAAGSGRLAACTAALAQALLRDPLGASVLTTVILAGLALWAAGASHAPRTWRRAAHEPLAAPSSPAG